MKGGLSVPVAERVHAPLDSQVCLTIERELETLKSSSFSVITILDSGYPQRLRTIPDPPPLLYVSGAFDKRDDLAIAIVGSRKATPAGSLLTQELSRSLASIGFTIVSGLARGVDKSAHQGALECSSGRTVAVLGCGIDQTYPVEHKRLRTQIETQGAVISEFPFGAAPHGYHFPQRNRIISGLSVGVVVTEATEKSGSLITARLALEQDREVFAVPGAVTSKMSRGPHRLIKQGAKLTENIEDIVEELLPQLDESFREAAAKSTGGITR